ncbi:MAG: acetyl-CoA hydrolase/transferase family protein [Syntrophales bacterium]|jgi:acyl-CoA hydrolase
MRKVIWDQYRSKLITADQAAKVVKSGDWVYFSHFVMNPVALDKALAKRVGEMTDVNISITCGMHPMQVAICDPEHKTFTYNVSFFSRNDRSLAKQGMAFFIPSNYHEQPWRIRNGFAPHPNVAMIKTTPMDKDGFFNFGTSCSYTKAVVENADVVILEINEGVPRCLGGHSENIHIADVDYIVETEKAPLMTIPKPTASSEEIKMAEFIIAEISDGACLQLGVGGIPNTVGSLIADSDLKNLGMHSEMICDAFVDLYERGKVTGLNKYDNKNKMVYTFAMGTSGLYEFLHDNPACATFPVDDTNKAENIARNDNVISINNALQVDLYGQISSESIGDRQISGSGGQGDFVIGAAKSRGGKAFICLRSTRMVNDQLVSRIVPDIQGITSVPRAWAFYVVTEFGKVCLKGQSTWQIAESVISIAHPSFQDDLIKAAEKKRIWRRSNKRT